MRKTSVLSLMVMVSVALFAQQKSVIRVYPDKGEQVIHKEIYGQFAEHLGRCIYGGIWVGEDSPIPNINGYRKDVFEALKELQVPVIRWPGGCFADEYHWMDGIGPREQRPKLVNTNWGGTVEDNSFGTHEFLNLCEMLGCEPYISGNVGSGTVEEIGKMGGIHDIGCRVGDDCIAPQEREREALESEIYRCGQRKLGLRRKHDSRILFRPIQALPDLLPQLRRKSVVQGGQWCE